jgi:hypothetical protein
MSLIIFLPRLTPEEIYLSNGLDQQINNRKKGKQDTPQLACHD